MVTTDIVLLGIIILHEEGVLWRIFNSLHIDGDHPDGNPSKELHPIGINIFVTNINFSNMHNGIITFTHTVKILTVLQIVL